MSDEIYESEGGELVSVFRAPDEVTAHLVKSVLEDAGIECTVVSKQVPWMDGIMVHGEGYWGDVMVRSDIREESLAVIEAYSAAQPIDMPEVRGEGEEEQT